MPTLWKSYVLAGSVTLVLLAGATIALIYIGPVVKGEQQVREALLDPNSAQFRHVSAHGSLVCGEINSKNRLGGYTGFQRFITSRSGPLLGGDLGGFSTSASDDANSERTIEQNATFEVPNGQYDQLGECDTLIREHDYCFFRSQFALCQRTRQPVEFVRACAHEQALLIAHPRC